MKNPDFIISGERRSGSTTIYNLLKMHSDINMYGISDMDFFIQDELFKREPVNDKDINEWESNHDIYNYRKLFPETNKKNGQKDADLLWWKPAHKRLAKYLPNTKFVIVLREPAKRAESQYWNEFRKGREKKSFKYVINYEPSSQWEKLHLDYKNRSCYVKSIEHFYKYIDSSRVKVVILENLFNNWREEMRDLAFFLNIDPEEAINLKPIHSNKEDVLIVNPKLKKFCLTTAINFYDRIILAILRRTVKSHKKRNFYKSKFLRFGKVSARKKFPIDKSLLLELRKEYMTCNKKLEQLLDIKLNNW